MVREKEGIRVSVSVFHFTPLALLVWSLLHPSVVLDKRKVDVLNDERGMCPWRGRRELKSPQGCMYTELLSNPLFTLVIHREWPLQFLPTCKSPLSGGQVLRLLGTTICCCVLSQVFLWVSLLSIYIHSFPFLKQDVFFFRFNWAYKEWKDRGMPCLHTIFLMNGHLKVNRGFCQSSNTDTKEGTE